MNANESASNKIAVITGASRGLGRSTALHLAARGVGIVGTYNSNADEAAAVAREIEAHGPRAALLQLDVTKTPNLVAFAQALPKTLESTFGRRDFDFLVNNAGTGRYAPFADTSEEHLDEMIAIHFKAPFILTQKLLPHIVDGGRILNISTGLARFTLPYGYSAYASAKGAVEVLTRYMAKELGHRNISVNVLAPGAIETDFGGGTLRDNRDMNAAVAATIALGRVGLPDDIGAAAAALLSSDTTWINGQRIEASGGQNL